MSGISVYLLSIVGVFMLSVLLDLMLSDGKMAKYIKGIMGLVLIFVIVSPLPKLLKSDFSFATLFNEEVGISGEYQEVFQNQQKRLVEQKLKTLLSQNGFSGTEIQIWGEYTENKLQINYIFVDLKNLVLSKESEHINKYEAITTLLIEQTGVDEGQVVFSD